VVDKHPATHIHHQIVVVDKHPATHILRKVKRPTVPHII
jgi:hypothetical protein